VIILIVVVFVDRPLGFLYAFLNIIELRIDFGHLKISFSESDLKIWKNLVRVLIISGK
jgi:hypothetical protein